MCASCKVSSAIVPAMMRLSYSFPAAVSISGADCVWLVLSVGIVPGFSTGSGGSDWLD